MANRINSAIKDLLETKKVTQKLVAETLNISQPSLNRRFHSNKVAFSKTEIDKILLIAGISQEEYKQHIISYNSLKSNTEYEIEKDYSNPSTTVQSHIYLLELKIEELTAIKNNLRLEVERQEKEISDKDQQIAELRQDKQMLIEDKNRLLTELGNLRDQA